MAKKTVKKIKDKTSPLDTFLGFKWKKQPNGVRRYGKWRLDYWYEGNQCGVTLGWDAGKNSTTPLYSVACGRTLSSALNNLERQLIKVVSLLQP
jgi:hypothetical protein